MTMNQIECDLEIKEYTHNATDFMNAAGMYGPDESDQSDGSYCLERTQVRR